MTFTAYYILLLLLSYMKYSDLTSWITLYHSINARSISEMCPSRLTNMTGALLPKQTEDI